MEKEILHGSVMKSRKDRNYCKRNAGGEKILFKKFKLLYTFNVSKMFS